LRAGRPVDHRGAGGRIAALEKQVAQLLEQLGQNSRNSHKPPSTDTPEERQKSKNREKKARQARKRGGQPGHRGASRELVSPEKESKFVDLFPAECESCWNGIRSLVRAAATRRAPPTTEHRSQHRLSARA
jgi:hypothetical protein